ncbi:MAG: PEGA domain-containing protein [Polyangiaceae bacterium]
MSITPAHAQSKGGAKPAAAAPAKGAGGGAKGGAKPAAKPDAKPAAKPDAKAAAKPDAKGKPDAKTAAKPDKDACATEPKPKLADAKKKDEAKKAYKSGETKFDKGEFEAALVCYKLAESYIPGANPKYKIAASLDKLGKITEAVAGYEAFLGAMANPPEDKYKEKIADAKTRVDALKATPSKVKLAIGPDQLQNMKVTLDGMPQTGTELTVPPGKHTIMVSADGYDTLTQPIEVSYAETKDMPLTLNKTPEPVATAVPTATATATAVAVATQTATATATAPVQPPSEPRSPVPAYVTLGLAGAGAIVGGIFGGMALSSKGDFDKMAADGKSTAKQLTDKADETDRNALISDMSFAVALTFGVTGAVLLLSDSSPASAPPAKTGAAPQKTKKAANILQRGFIAPYATPTGAGAAARFTF